MDFADAGLGLAVVAKVSVAVEDVTGGGDGFGQALFNGALLAEKFGDDVSDELRRADDAGVGPVACSTGQVEFVFAPDLLVDGLSVVDGGAALESRRVGHSGLEFPQDIVDFRCFVGLAEDVAHVLDHVVGVWVDALRFPASPSGEGVVARGVANAGSHGIHLDVFDALPQGGAILQQHVFESVGPKSAVSSDGSRFVVPVGEQLLEILHEAAEIVMRSACLTI